MSEKEEAGIIERRVTLRPRDAATLIVVRQGPDGPEVLMGERSARHVFVPNNYVFPGGSVDRADAFVEPATPLEPHVLASLTRTATPRRAVALALAAIRETYEETGIVIGRPRVGKAGKAPAGWAEFYATGRQPVLGGLAYVARAVTPTTQPRRFNARFFAADAAVLGDDILGEHGGGSGELEGQHWVTIPKARTLKIRPITGLVLDEIEARLRGHGIYDPGRPVPAFRTAQGRRVITHE
jgi:8-oxo-dGTP pyrophosphatase MutT (NUDIX family)